MLSGHDPRPCGQIHLLRAGGPSRFRLIPSVIYSKISHLISRYRKERIGIQCVMRKRISRYSIHSVFFIS